jgi:DNA topoisomerase-1
MAAGSGSKSDGERALVIVESPTKARTIKAFLPKGFTVEASIGHIRDLPNSAKEIPAEIKDQAWARLGIDIDNDFQPIYVVPSEKKKQVTKLRSLLKEASVLYLATDEDREGESISWHLVQVLKPKVPRKRLVFHEITKSAIKKALDSPRDLDERLIQAQEARRILDRLYGYEVSPILWRKVGPGLSAGRVQSVAIRLVVERERARMVFVRSSYWDLLGSFATQQGGPLTAGLLAVGGLRVAIGKDFDSATGKLKLGADGKPTALHLDEDGARALVERLQQAAFKVTKVERKPYTDRPGAPFTTSTLQQEANRKLRLTAKQTMQAAQRLYENGFITYMRTDSVTLSQEAVTRTRGLIEDLYGKAYLSPEPRQYQTKVKNAQEAHEAIRPAGDFQTPEAVRTAVGEREAKLYEFIWKRTMACQMADARGHRTTLQVTGEDAIFQTSGKTIEFPGFLRAYVQGADDPDAELADKEIVLPAVAENDPLTCAGLEARGHQTQPPARYTEASLVKELEARGIGRPSTYASIIDTIQQRRYVVKQGNALVPTFTAFAVVKLLESHFEDLVDFEFTARMEDDLDAISLGDRDSVPYLRSFYFGNGHAGLKSLVQAEIDPRESRTLTLGKDAEGKPIEIRIGRYGPYLECGEERAPIPEMLAPDELSAEKALELIAQGSGPRELGVDKETGKPVFARNGRFGPYVQLGNADDDEKPKMKSLVPGMVLEELTLEQAQMLLSLPRLVGVDPENGEEIYADQGRYGPYIRRGSDTRSLAEPPQVFTVSVAEAVELLKQEKRRGRSAPKILKELGNHPESGEPVKLLAGRYGPYVTDGDVNASISRDDDPEAVTLEQALDLLARRAATKGTGKKKTKKKAAKKKTTKKKTTKKKTTKKKTTKKKASRKKK